MSRKPPVALPDTEDPYLLLDVRPGASADQIRRAYLRRVKMYKPDRHPAEFRKVREAYDRLREQERWFDAWRQANEVVRQAAEAEAARGDGRGGGDERHADAGDEEHDELGDAGDDANRGGDFGEHGTPYDERHDEDEGDDGDADDEDLAALMAALEDELREGRNGGRGPLDGGRGPLDDEHEPDEYEHGHDAGEDASPIDLADRPRRDPAEDARRSQRAAELTERLAALEQQVHAALHAGACTKAATLLLASDTDALAARPELATLLLEVCCAVVWDQPAQFQALVDRYGDLVSAHDTEYRDGALLHRRTLTHELAGWRQAVAGWPELHQFLVLGASLRAPAEAELGLRLGKRAAADAKGFLHVLAVAAVHAPGIVALYVGMAERWSRHYGRLSLPGPPTRRPTLVQAADAVALAVQHHRLVRWEQLRPLLVSTILVVVLMLARSPVVELVVIGMVVVLWGWRAWVADPETRIYLRVVRPAAAAWLWATRTSPDELAAALRSRLPAAGTWGAVLHPGDLTQYPDQLADDLALLAFSVTAPMIPLLRSPENRSGSGSGTD